MSSIDKAELARAGTMEATSKEGKAYLEKNLTEWKKPLLIDQAGDVKKATNKKKGGAKKTTFKEVAAADDDNDDDDDDEDEDDDQPAAKKARLSKTKTMDVTAKEGKDLLGGKKLGDTRQVTKAKQNAARATMKRASTMQKAVDEATAYGYGSSSSKRAARKSASAAKPAAKKSSVKAKKSLVKKSVVKKSTKAVAKKAVKKAAMKKAGTMQATAKEGKRLIGGQKLGDTRQVTKSKQKKKK